MSLSRKIADFFNRRAVSEKRALRRERDLAVNASELWRKLADSLARDCETYSVRMDEMRGQLGFANEEIAKLSAEVKQLRAELQSARAGCDATFRDALKYIDGLAALEAELIDNHGWSQERCDELTGLGDEDEPMTKQDVAEEVGHQKYREKVEEEEKR